MKYNIAGIIARAKAGACIDIDHEFCLITLGSKQLKAVGDTGYILQKGEWVIATDEQIAEFFK